MAVSRVGNTGIKYSTRVADANAARQEQERAQQLLQNGQGQTDAGVRERLLQGAAGDPQAQQVLQQAQLQGQNQTLNRDTGQTQLAGNGAIQQSAIDRLRESGMNDQQIQEQLQGLQPQIQSTMSNTGQGMNFDPSTGLAIPGSQGSTVESRAEDAANAVLNELSRSNIGDPITLERAASQARQNVYNEETARTQAANAEAERVNRSTVAEAAAGEASRESAPKPISVDDAAEQAALQSVLSMPGAENLGPAILQGYEAYKASQSAAYANREENLGRAEESFNDFKDFISIYEAKAKESRDNLQGILEQNKEETEKMLKEKEANDRERLQYERDLAKQEAERLKTEDMTKASIELALSGGAFSGASLERVASAEREWNKTILNIQKEFAFKDADVSAFYTEKYVNLQGQHRLDIFNATQVYDQKIEGYAQQGFSSLQAKKNAEAAAQNQFRSDIAAAKTSYAGMIEKMTLEANNRILQEKTLQAQEARWQYEQEWQEYSFGVNKDMQMLQMQLMQQERDENQEIRLDQNAQSKLLQTTNQISSRIKGDTNVTDYKTSAFHFNTLDAAFRNANSQGGKNFTDQVLINSFNKMTDPNSVVRESEFARSAEGLGLFESLHSKYLKNFGVKKEVRDDGSIEFSIGQGGTLSPDAREELYNVAKTINDARKQMYLEDTIQKYYLQLETYNSIAPEGYKLTPEEFGLPAHATSGQQNNFMQLAPPGYSSPFSNPNGGGGSEPLPKVGGKLQSMAVTGTVTGYGSKKSAAGVDIAAPKGTPVKAHVGGTIVKVVDQFRESFPNNDAKGRSQNGGYGNQVVVKFDNGMTGLFSHLDSTAVKGLEGKKIKPGTTLGFIGNTGNTYGKTGIHLDFELRDASGKKLSPQKAAQFLLSSNIS